MLAGLHPVPVMALGGLGRRAAAPAKYGLVTELVPAAAGAGQCLDRDHRGGRRWGGAGRSAERRLAGLAGGLQGSLAALLAV